MIALYQVNRERDKQVVRDSATLEENTSGASRFSRESRKSRCVLCGV
jgi:hypothetical protein